MLLTVLLSLSCSRVRLSDAREHYVRGEYHEAVTAYRKLYRHASREEVVLRGVIAFEMAENYRLLNRSAHAVTAYRNAIRYGYPDTLAQRHLAQMLHREGDYPKAADAYRLYLANVPGDAIAIAGLQGAEAAMDTTWQPDQMSGLYHVRRFDLFNSSRSDFSPHLAHDDERLFFTSSRESTPNELRSPVTGTKYHDLFFSVKNSRGEWQKPKRVEFAGDTDFDEGVASLTSDGMMMFFTAAYVTTNQPSLPAIYLSRRFNGSWSPGTRLILNGGDSLSLFAHPTVSASGSTLYFVSDMPGGMGGKDIWQAHLNSRQEVIRLENAGAAINTPGNEMFPLLRNDTTLYFSSDGHPGLGGLDLFRAVKTQAGGDWHLTHLPPPLNSSADDFGITFEEGEERGFFSSNRNDNRGYDHIYAFAFKKPLIHVEGFVVERNDIPIQGAIIDLVGSDGSRLQLVTNREGLYHFTAKEGVSYLFLAQAEGFLNRNASLGPVIANKDTTCYLDFEMTPYDRPVVMENIFYDFDRAVLRSESKEELDKLLQLMLEHPEIGVELSAHTDRRGADSYNEELSLRRARSVVDYLISSGIAPERLTSVGEGKMKPKRVDSALVRQHPFLREGEYLTDEYIKTLLPAEQATADQLNRRTEFRVLPSH
ncbi:OmpA family protein [Dysgonomonadaceae bacterium zrk40]|nr:OmpA family protein [Dysgonomonadaceae bacterium zrk40]